MDASCRLREEERRSCLQKAGTRKKHTSITDDIYPSLPSPSRGAWPHPLTPAPKSQFSCQAGDVTLATENAPVPRNEAGVQTAEVRVRTGCSGCNTQEVTPRNPLPADDTKEPASTGARRGSAGPLLPEILSHLLTQLFQCPACLFCRSSPPCRVHACLQGRHVAHVPQESSEGKLFRDLPSSPLVKTAISMQSAWV